MHVDRRMNMLDRRAHKAALARVGGLAALGLFSAACGGGEGSGASGTNGAGAGGPTSSGPGAGAGGGGSSSTSTSSSGGPDAGKPVALTCSDPPGGAAPPAAWSNVTANLAGMGSECGNLTMVSAEPCSNRVIAGIARQGLWVTENGGASWSHLGRTGDPLIHRPTGITYDPEHPGTFYEAGIYGWEDPYSDGVFITTNDGASFQGYKGLSAIQSHNDSVSVDFHDPGRKTLVSGGHEQKQVLFVSHDAGDTWDDVGMALPADTGFCTTSLVIDANTFVVGCMVSWSGANGAILRTTDGGKTFAKRSESGVVGQPLWANDGAIYWALEAGGIAKSTDLGKTWEQTVDGSQAGGAPPIELPDGRIASIGPDRVVLSSDGGVSWTPIGEPVPHRGGLAYSSATKTFFVWHNDCGNVVLADAVMSAGFDYTAD
jgi:hypothetical protein